MNNLYICLMVLAHYDKAPEADLRIVLDMESHYEVVEAEGPEEAIDIAEQRFAYNKQYFEVLMINALEVNGAVLGYCKNALIKKYSDIQDGQSYRVVSEDIFTKGKENWDAAGDWDVILK